VGVATYLYHTVLGNERTWKWEHAYLGPEYNTDEIRTFLDENGIVYKEYDENGMLDATVQALIDQKTIGWFQGRMEFGPRALGARSILGDARSPSMQKMLNLKVKYRESFRPFAPSVLRERVADWFELDEDSPYMLLVADVVPERRRLMNEDERALFGIDKLNVVRSQIPAVTHVDYSARVQTVHADTNPRYHALLEAFHERTGCPVLVNTSFNVRGEPIVGTPTDAYRCFMRTEMDHLVLGPFLLDKAEQTALAEDDNWQQAFALD
jgi:carbamoyltransferase